MYRYTFLFQSDLLLLERLPQFSPLLIAFISIATLILLISWARISPFLSFLIVSICGGIAMGIKPANITHSIEKGLGDTLGQLLIIISLGAMLGKLVAVSGAAIKISSTLMNMIGRKSIQWAMVGTGFIVGIPLFYNVGFVLMVPIIFSVVSRYKLPAVYIGLPMLAALSVTHGFLPPHPSPVALVTLFHANMGLTLLYGIIVAIPAIILAGPVFSRTLRTMNSQPLSAFQSFEVAANEQPSAATSFIAALLPVMLLGGASFLKLVLPSAQFISAFTDFLGNPTIVMLISLTYATYMLGIRHGKKLSAVMAIYADAVKDISGILLIIGGAGCFKQVLSDSGVSIEIANILKSWDIHPLLLGWLIAAFIRVAVGSATIAGLTTAGIIAPLIISTGVNPNLMVLSIGAGSLMFSHVNDPGFWMFKEYFNLSMKDTLRSWSLMETIVSVVGIVSVMLLNSLIK